MSLLSLFVCLFSSAFLIISRGIMDPGENDLGSDTEPKSGSSEFNLNPNHYWVRLELKGTVGQS